MAETWCKRLLAPWFRPDLTVAADPLSPEASPIAQGVAEAVRRCVSEDRPFRLWIAPVPGFRTELRIHAARRTAMAEIFSSSGRSVSRSEARLPAVVPGISQSRFRMERFGDAVRLRFFPTSRGPSWTVH